MAMNVVGMKCCVVRASGKQERFLCECVCMCWCVLALQLACVLCHTIPVPPIRETANVMSVKEMKVRLQPVQCLYLFT